MIRLLAAAGLVGLAHGQSPVRMAGEARFWLKVPPGQPVLGSVSVSPGECHQAAWETAPAVRSRLTDFTVPIHWWDWTEITVRITPEHDGSVDLDLNGPWSPETNGRMPRKEVLWDDLHAIGTDLRNGSFEQSGNSLPEHWRTPWEPAPDPGQWPLKTARPKSGRHLAATWSKRPLVQTLHLKAGIPVTLRLFAKAATPPDFRPPKPLGAATPAHRAAATIRRGVNLGCGWEVPPGENWSLPFSTADIDRIADEGFDHIRVPVAWHFHMRPDGTSWRIDPAFQTTLEPILRRALERKLTVILNWHHFHDLTKDPAAHRARFTAVWRALAGHFRDWPAALWFELLNEPCDALTTETANPIYQDTIAAIRTSNPTRILMASPGRWGSTNELGTLRLPDEDERILVTVHCYDPFHFTHQGAGWVGLTDLRGVRYPGPPSTPLRLPPALQDNTGARSFLDSYNTLHGEQNPSSIRPVREALDTAASWSKHFGRPVHLGEFGAHDAGDTASRARYLRDVRTLAESRKIPWTLWEWKASFGYWNPATGTARFRNELIAP